MVISLMEKMLELLKSRLTKRKEVRKKNKYVLKLFIDTRGSEPLPSALSTVSEAMTKTSSAKSLEALPEDFFDNRVEGAMAMGLKQKAAEKQVKELGYA